MEPRRLELLTPCMPFRHFGRQKQLQTLGWRIINTNYVRRKVRRFVLLQGTYQAEITVKIDQRRFDPC